MFCIISFILVDGYLCVVFVLLFQHCTYFQPNTSEKHNDRLHSVINFKHACPVQATTMAFMIFFFKYTLAQWSL